MPSDRLKPKCGTYLLPDPRSSVIRSSTARFWPTALNLSQRRGGAFSLSNGALRFIGNVYDRYSGSESDMKTIKGPGLFLGQFAGDTAPFNSWDAITKWAADIGYKGVQVPTWAQPADRPQEGGDLQGLLRRGHRHRRAKTASRSPSFPPICRASSLPFTRPMTKPSTALRRRKCAAIRRRVRNGRSSRSSWR